MASITLKSGVGGSFTLSIDADASGSYVSGTATISSSTGSFADHHNTYLKLLINESEVSSVQLSSLNTGGSYSVSGGTNVGDGNITVTASWVNNASSTYAPASNSVSTSVSVSTVSSGSLSISKSSASIDETQTITLTAGKGNSFTGLSWSCNGKSGSLSASSQTWNLSVLESVLNNTTSATCVITASQSSYGNLTASFTVTVPTKYKPTIKLSKVNKYNTSNNYLISNQSNFDVEYITSLTPSNNTCGIKSVVVSSSAYNPSGVGTPQLTVTGSKVVSSILPYYSGASNYRISFTLVVTDNRGRTETLRVTEDDIGTIYNYIPPAITGYAVYRSDASGNIRPSGQYGYGIVSILSDTSLTIAKVTVNNVDYNLNALGNNQYNVIFGNNALDIGTQYKVTLSVQNTMMQSYGDVIQQVALLPTMQMPLSLFDDGSQVVTSIGEMAFHYSGVGDSKSILNLAANSSIRVTNSSGTTKVIKSYDLVTKCPFPINSIYLSVTSTNPSSLWEGTTWEQIAQGRTLIGQGSGTDVNGISKSFSNGSTGGEYSHALTVQEMPSHNHRQQTSNWIKRGVLDGEKGVGDDASGFNGDYYTQNTGGGDYHNNIQPYLVVYIWKRTS